MLSLGLFTSEIRQIKEISLVKNKEIEDESELYKLLQDFNDDDFIEMCKEMKENPKISINCFLNKKIKKNTNKDMNHIENVNLSVDLLKCNEFTIEEAIILSNILSYSKTTGFCFLSERKLSKLLDITIEEYLDIIFQLTEAGWLVSTEYLTKTILIPTVKLTTLVKY